MSMTTPPTSSSDLFARTPRLLDPIFSPRSVAVIGASESPGSVGRTLLRNLIESSFGGRVYPVNPNHPTILGAKAFPTILDLPEKIDLAVIATPAPTVPGIIAQCVAANASAAIIISAGFRELGSAGLALEKAAMEEARRGSIRLIGPNCLGVMNPLTGLNATFAGAMARPGNVAFLSQSGALCSAILDWSLNELVGFSAFVSTGSMLDVGWGDLIDHLGSDPQTRSILIYMESIGDARSFLSAAREVALTKPIIVLKAGRTEAASKAAASHTGSLTGSDEVLDAAFRRVGVLRVNNISDLFYMAEALARQPRPKGPRLTILTNAGGPGVLAADALIGAGGELSVLSAATRERLDAILPAHWSRANPIDILGDADPARYQKAVEIAAADSNSDGLLVVLTPQDMTGPTQTAEALEPYANLSDRPILASWMGGSAVRAGEEILNRAGIPTFTYPDTAARAFQYMWRYTYNLRGIYETPASIDAGIATAPGLAPQIIAAAGAEGRTLLDEAESKRLLAAYGIPIVRTEIALTADAATAAAVEIGFPVALKLYSRTITHKTDVKGVELNLAAAADVPAAFERIRCAVQSIAGEAAFAGVTVQPMARVSDAYEIILGSSVDPQFGPVLLFGAGGQLVEIFKDRALGLPPLNATLARRMMEQTQIYKALLGVRGRKPVDIERLAELLVRFSRLVIENPRIREIDVNPLLAGPEQIVALDARMALYPAETPQALLPRPAIRPYPSQYVAPWTMKDGTALLIRPIAPEDEPLLKLFHATLSQESVEMRYFHLMKLSRRIAHDRLTRVCFNDYDRELALVAEHREGGERRIVAVSRLSRWPGERQAEFAILVSDAWQGRGLGSELLRRSLEAARAENISRVTAELLPGNGRMQHLFERQGFTIAADAGGATAHAAIELK